MKRTAFLAILSLMMLVGVSTAQTTADISPSKDNTLYQHGAGMLSNGAGAHLFAGTTATGQIRRALLHFPVAESIPANASVTSVELTLNMSRTISGGHTVALRRVLADWGEGTSAALGEEGAGTAATANDATWLHRFFDTQFWNSPGGDFAAASSATVIVADEGSYTWGSTQALVADVQHWLENPEENFGWILIGNESANATAKRFDSRHHSVPANRPVLTVTYTIDLPVELVSFHAGTDGHTVTLHWSTASETNNHGFEVQRLAYPEEEWHVRGFVEGAGSSIITRNYAWVDELENRSGIPRILNYRLRQVDFDGTASYSPVLMVDTGVPDAISLGDAFPNPARAGATILYAIPNAQHATITLYDLLGRAVRVPVDGHHEPGWHRVLISVDDLAPGLYHYELRAAHAHKVRQMVVSR